MPVLHDPIQKCLSVFLKQSERLNIEEDHLTMLISCFLLVIPTLNIGKLELLLLDYQTKITQNYQKQKMMTIKKARGLISIT